MKKDKHTLTYKKYIKAEKRLNQIYKEKRSFPLIPLKEPYQKGWRLKIVLRDDFLRSDKGPIIRGIIEKLAVEFVIRNPKLVSQIRKKSALADVRSIKGFKLSNYWNGGGPYIQYITKAEYIALSEQQKKYFDPLPPLLRFTNKQYELNIPIHYFIVKVDKNMMTHTIDINPALLKEEAELKKILAPYYRNRGYGMGYYHWHENRQERRKSKVELTKIDTDEALHI